MVSSPSLHPVPITIPPFTSLYMPSSHGLRAPMLKPHKRNQSLRIVPQDAQSSTYSHIRPSQKPAPSAPGLHDTLRAGVGPSPSAPSDAVQSAHPLEARLRAWEATQHALRMESLRRTFGIAEPVRRGMELKIAREGEWKPAALGGGPGGASGVHEDVLRGREAVIEWEDVFTGEEQRAAVGVHDEIERKVRM